MRQITRLICMLVAVLLLARVGDGGEPWTSKNLTEVARYPWGLYSVVVEEIDWQDPELSQLWEQYGFAKRVQIRDGSGQVLREIRNVVAGKEEIHFIRPGSGGTTQIEVNFVEMTGAGLPEFHIKTYAGGAHCCFVHYYFTQDGGLRNLLIFVGGNVEALEPRDLNGDGRPELVGDSDVLAYFEGLCFACSPTVQLVIGWDGQAYRDQTKAYPQLARKVAQEYKAEFLRFLSAPELPVEKSLSSREAAALGYYANSLVIGEGAAARAWLLRHAPKETRRWLFGHEEELRKQLARSECKIRISQERLLELVGDEC